MLVIFRHKTSKRSDIKILGYKTLNDDLLPTLTSNQVAETRVSNDLRVDANMASGEHYLQYGVRIVDWTIYF